MDSKARIRTLAATGQPLKPNHIAYVDQKTGTSVIMRHCWDGEAPEVVAAVLEAAKRLALSRTGIVRTSVSIYSTRRMLLDVVRYDNRPNERNSKAPSRAKLKITSYTFDKYGRIAESEIQAIEALTDHAVDDIYRPWKSNCAAHATMKAV